MSDNIAASESQPSPPAPGEGFEVTPAAAERETGLSPARMDRANWPPSALAAEAAVRDAYQSNAPDTQFTLRDLFLLVTICAAIFFPASRLPRPFFAGLVGGMTVLLMLVQTFFEPRHALFRYGWWVLLFLYLMACGMAAGGW